MFDLITLRLISMVGFACFTLATFFLWRIVPQERSLRDWSLASAKIVVGLLLLGLYGIIPDFLSLATGNAVLMLGLGSVYIGTRHLLGLGSGFAWHWLVAAVTFIFCLLVSSVSVRVVATSALYTPFFFACAWLFWNSKWESGLHVIKRIAALIFAAGGVLFVCRALIRPSTTLTSADFVISANWFEVSAYVYLIAFSMWMLIALLLIVSVRLQNKRIELLAQDALTNCKLRESENRYRTLIECSPNAAVVHQNGALLYVNPAATKLFGAGAAQDLVGQRILDLTHPDFHQTVTDRMLQSSIAEYAEPISGGKYLTLDRTPFDAEIQSAAITYEGDPAVYTVIRDVTARLQSEAELRITAIAFESQDGMIVTDANLTILRVNRSFTDAKGYSADESIGETFNKLILGRQDTAFYASMWDSIQRIGTWRGEIWSRRKNGEAYPEELTITSVLGGSGRVVNYVATMRDITQRKQLEENAHRLAYYDPLTRLPNRRLFNDRLTQTLTRAKRTQSRFALMFIDLDKFKPINDEHGHEVGDWVLESVARRIESCLRTSDTAARVGGDEFLVLLSDIKTSNDALTVAEKIRLEVERPFVTPSQLSLRASSSIGIAVYPDHANTEQDLRRLSDHAMYQVKNSGGNNVQMCALSSEPEVMDKTSARPPVSV